MNTLYLITGAAGHLGNTVVQELIKLKKEIRILVLPNEKNIPDGDIEVCYGDVRDKDSLSSFFHNQKKQNLILIHCAGIVTIASKYVQEVYDVNVTGTINIVDLCVLHKVQKLLYVSSVHAIPERSKGKTISEVSIFNPKDVTGLYAKTKSQATNYVLNAAKSGLDASVVHPSGICGPFDNGRGHMTTLVIDYYKGRLTSGVNGGYDFVDVRDVANGIIQCCEKGKKGECYILSNKYYSIREILFILHEITGKREIKNFLPLWFVKLTASLAETYYKILRQPPLFTAYSIYTLNTNAVFSHKKAELQLGYTARDLRITLEDAITWLKDNKRI